MTCPKCGAEMVEEEKSVKVPKKGEHRIVFYTKYTCPKCRHWFTLS